MVMFLSYVTSISELCNKYFQ